MNMSWPPNTSNWTPLFCPFIASCVTGSWCMTASARWLLDLHDLHHRCQDLSGNTKRRALRFTPSSQSTCEDQRLRSGPDGLIVSSPARLEHMHAISRCLKIKSSCKTTSFPNDPEWLETYRREVARDGMSHCQSHTKSASYMPSLRRSTVWIAPAETCWHSFLQHWNVALSMVIVSASDNISILSENHSMKPPNRSLCVGYSFIQRRVFWRLFHAAVSHHFGEALCDLPLWTWECLTFHFCIKFSKALYEWPMQRPGRMTFLSPMECCSVHDDWNRNSTAINSKKHRVT